jgi:hypothetical protein
LHDFSFQTSRLFGDGAAVYFAMTMPTNMAGTKKSVPLATNGNDVNAGPGQKPPKPQPMPKVAAPKTSLASKSVRVGR